MTSFQKIIKYFAIGLAIFIIVNIISAIFFGFSTLVNIFEVDNNNSTTEKLNSLDVKDNNISSLDIDLSSTSLTIKKSTSLKVKTNNKYINYKQTSNKLSIEEKDHNWLTKNTKHELIIYLPEDILLTDVEISSTAGEIEIEELNTNELSFDFGAGKATIDTLNVTKEAEIEGGAGEIKILSGNINNLDLDMGVGKFSINSKLTGNNKIDAGIGEIDLKILNNKEDYSMNVNKGIGTIHIDGENINTDQSYGTGSNYIEIDGGIGNISIDFEESTQF